MVQSKKYPLRFLTSKPRAEMCFAVKVTGNFSYKFTVLEHRSWELSKTVINQINCVGKSQVIVFCDAIQSFTTPTYATLL